MASSDGFDRQDPAEKRAAVRPRDPSYVDRRRLDSDVRAFMRQPSTPWITFDRDSKVAAGEIAIPRAVLSSFRSSIHDGMFKQAESLPAEPPPSSSRLEPSSLIVAHDIAVPEVLAVPREAQISLGDVFVSPRGRMTRWLVTGVAALAVVGVGLAISSAASTPRSSAASALAVEAPKPTSLAPAAEPRAEVPPPAEAAPAAPAPKAVAKDDPKGKLGRLAIRGDAVRTNIWLDGTRMLGRGPRAFDVMCGTHTIAVGAKTDATEMEIPCGGELVLSNAK
jgi:hypothetical protein